MVKGILDILNSELDRYGNTYWAFRFTDCKTGRQVVGTISGGESNICAVFNHEAWRGWKWNEIYSTHHTLKRREFTNATSDWPYAGCTPDQLSKFIQAGLKAKKK